MQLNRWDVARFALRAAAAAVALYYFLSYSAGCSFARGPVRGRGELGDVAGDDAAQNSGRALRDAGEQLEQLDAGDVAAHDAAVDAGELEQLDAGQVDAGELEQRDAAADAGQVDAGGAQCVLTCEAKGYPGGKLCNPTELPGRVLCCCAAKPSVP